MPGRPGLYVTDVIPTRNSNFSTTKFTQVADILHPIAIGMS